MPLTLPEGSVPLVPVDAALADVLGGSRVTQFDFDLLNSDDGLIRTLNNVVPGGSVDWDATAAVKGGGRITVSDLGTDIDWLNVRIRPRARVSRAGLPDEPLNIPLGVFIPAAPVEKWTDTGRSWDVELLDKASILDQDIYTDPDTGVASTYSAPVGTNVIAAVKALIIGAGESADAIPDADVVTTANLTWDLGTTRLKIINDLLDAGNYLSLWVDGEGRFKASPYVPPAERAPTYVALAPFTYGPTSLFAPDWTRDRDYYAVPNRWVATSQGDEDTEAMIATATNTDPASPFSFPSRGRWITTVETGIEVVDQAALDAYAQRQLAAAASVTSAITVNHVLLPDLVINTTVRFTYPDADIDDVLFVVAKTSVEFDPVGLCSTTLQEAIAV